jgi:hypothetical protein
MDSAKKRWLAVLNVVGGTAVLASYVVGLGAVSGEALWGGVPESVRPLYTINMLLAASGYFLFTYYILFKLNSETTRVAGRFGYGIFFLLYAMILLPSALWLPLTGVLVAQPGHAIWTGVLGVLTLAGLGSLGLLACLLNLGDDAPRGRALAVLGLIPFCLQTAVLDAVVWPTFFPFPSP